MCYVIIFIYDVMFISCSVSAFIRVHLLQVVPLH